MSYFEKIYKGGETVVRLDKAVALTGMTRTEARKAIAAGRVQVNGQAARTIPGPAGGALAIAGENRYNKCVFRR